MIKEKEMTAHNSSVGADERQSNQICSVNSITENDEDCKIYSEVFEKMQRELQLQMNPSYLKTITMTDLYDTVFETQSPLIDGLLCRGTYLFVGSPKVGKSFMMAQLAYHVSTGTPLWNYPVRKSAVLYFALEDDYPRLQRRLYQMFGTDGTDNLYFATECKTVNGGLEDQIRGFMTEHPDTGLIIIDTLKRIREAGGADYSYGSDYDIVARLKSLADSYKVTMLIVHHTRKQQANDKFDMISGTTGLLGAADGAFVLSKENRTANAATLDITGRDQQDQKLYLNRNPETLQWDLDHIETELWKEKPDPLLEEISKIVTKENPIWNGTATELVDFLGVDMKPNTLSMKLNINAGRLFNEYGIRYENKRCHDGRKISLKKEVANTA